MSLTNYKEDHASTSKELGAVLDYLEKLKPQCETKVMTSASGGGIRPEKQSRKRSGTELGRRSGSEVRRAQGGSRGGDRGSQGGSDHPRGLSACW